jgi:hypothetical protein
MPDVVDGSRGCCREILERYTSGCSDLPKHEQAVAA